MADDPKFSDEIKKMDYEPLSPIEYKLIFWSLGIGVTALGFFYWLSKAYFPGGH
ncbi:MAG: hypothetical protein L7F77_10010 [Candidatus Magnetominusculus sp. LBB02]|nr:hypothetical protein [Candidatus Magnetominusculus sp. LBB02]